MTALIQQLLDFARPRTLQKGCLRVDAMFARVCELLATIAKKAQVSLQRPETSLQVDADDAQLQQVLTNLMINAIHASPAGTTVELAAREVEVTAPPHVGSTNTRWLAIDVRDRGTGMDAATAERVFEPFFSTKGIGEGTGLGLSVSWGIIREHGGWIAVESAPGEGSTFTVYLPRGVTA